MRRFRFGFGASALVLLLAAAAPTAFAVVTASPVQISPASLIGPDLGKIVQGASVSVFGVDPNSGAVTRVSGTAIRLTSGPSNPPLVTISCTAQSCKNGGVTVTFAPTGSGRANVTGFTPGAVTGHGLTLVSTTGAGTTHLTMQFASDSTANPSASFAVGVSVTVGATGATGLNHYGYVITAQKS
jgi:hypothetical protein